MFLARKASSSTVSTNAKQLPWKKNVDLVKEGQCTARYAYYLLLRISARKQSFPSLSPVIDATKLQANSAEKDKPLRKPLVPMKENATDGELKGVGWSLCIISLIKSCSKMLAIERYLLGQPVHSRAPHPTRGRSRKRQSSGKILCLSALKIFHCLFWHWQETGLARWKGLSAAEKEEYKVISPQNRFWVLASVSLKS